MTSETFTLYSFPTMPGFFNMSPYCTKAEIFLKLADAGYRLEMPEDFKVFPKGKLPVIKDGGQIVEDSEFIRLHLAEQHGITLDEGLTDADKAIGHAVCRMLDARTSQAIVWCRWIEDEGWAQTRPMFFREAPEGVAEEARGRVQARLLGSDFGVHSQAEKKRLIAADLAAISTLLGERDWFLSDKPTYLDATIFGFIANLYAAPIRTWLRQLVEAHDNLVEYFARGMMRWYPEGMKLLVAEAAE